MRECDRTRAIDRGVVGWTIEGRTTVPTDTFLDPFGIYPVCH